jgi:hypothetical protein
VEPGASGDRREEWAALAAEAAEGAELTLALEEFWWLIFFL